MILIENTQIVGFEAAIRGIRNSTHGMTGSDSEFNVNCDICDNPNYNCETCPTKPFSAEGSDNTLIGPNDLDLMLHLAKSGSLDDKFRRMITVYVDITAPLYWWKEFDAYRIDATPNFDFTMRKIYSKPFTMDDFSHEHILGEDCIPDHDYQSSHYVLSLTIGALNFWREIYIGENAGEMIGESDKRAWWQMIQLLPSSYNQKQTVMLNYEALAILYQHGCGHQLDEWQNVCRWIKGLPYSEIITCNTTEKDKSNALTAAIAKLKGELKWWDNDQIASFLLEQAKLFTDGKTVDVTHLLQPNEP